MTEDPKAKKAFKDIVKRGIDASPAADKQWGDALLQAVDTFDVEVRSAASGKAAKATPSKGDKKAPTKAAKPVNPARPTPKKEPDPDLGDLDDPWFVDDEPELGPAGGTKAEPKSKPKRAPAAATPVDDDDDFPDLPEPSSAAFNVGGDDEEEYRSPFANIGFGGSSWDDVPDWTRDAEKMPRAGGGSMRIPGSPKDDGPSGPSPVGRPWTDKDLEPKKKGLLGRLFGRKK